MIVLTDACFQIRTLESRQGFVPILRTQSASRRFAMPRDERTYMMIILEDASIAEVTMMTSKRLLKKYSPSIWMDSLRQAPLTYFNVAQKTFP